MPPERNRTQMLNHVFLDDLKGLIDEENKALAFKINDTMSMRGCVLNSITKIDVQYYEGRPCYDMMFTISKQWQVPLVTLSKDLYRNSGVLNVTYQLEQKQQHLPMLVNDQELIVSIGCHVRDYCLHLRECKEPKLTNRGMKKRPRMDLDKEEEEEEGEKKEERNHQKRRLAGTEFIFAKIPLIP